METQSETSNSGGGDDMMMSITTVKEMRQQLETRIQTRHKEQEELVASIQTHLVPDLFSSLNLSLQLLSSFHRRPFTPLTPPPPPSTTLPPPPPHPPSLKKPTPSFKPPSHPSKKRDPTTLRNAGTPMSVVRSMVAVCLLERVPFSPIDHSTLVRKIENHRGIGDADKGSMRELGGGIAAVEMALRSLAEESGIVELGDCEVSGKSRVMVIDIDRNRLGKELAESHKQKLLQIEGVKASGQEMWEYQMRGGRGGRGGMMMRQDKDEIKDLEALISKKSFKEQQKYKTGEELSNLIGGATFLQKAIAAKFKSRGGPQLKEYCLALTKEDCRQKCGSFIACEKVHFRRIIALHTDVNLGDCSFLDTCRHMKTCKYVHYELDPTPDVSPMMGVVAPPKPLKTQRAHYCSEVELGQAQWINCDIRNFRMDILGQFGVIMADPPWDIHMELPYGTMADDEMRTLNVPALQTDGLIFLWVTGRAMELGRECLELWGYKRVEEIIWVKTNQLQRIIRTGRTGHWLNHSKEHCLVGIKGNPVVNRNIDTDVIVAEVRETSRKPDEMYPLLERISPRTRKLELFARMHNTQSGWLALGNQLNGVRLVDEGLRARFKAAYPEVEVQPPSPPRSSAMDVDPPAAEVRNPFSGAESKSTPLLVSQPAVEAACVSEDMPLGSQDTEMVS